jgi:hypothetical protein
VFTLVSRVQVAVRSPADGARYYSPATIPIQASAGTTSGSISEVGFFCGTTNLGGALTPPYSITWSNVPSGDYVLSASVTNSLGDYGESSAVHVTVVGPPALAASPTTNGIAISWPASLTNFILEAATNPYQPLFWSSVTNTPQLDGNQLTTTLSSTAACQFFRLQPQ